MYQGSYTILIYCNTYNITAQRIFDGGAFYRNVIYELKVNFGDNYNGAEACSMILRQYI